MSPQGLAFALNNRGSNFVKEAMNEHTYFVQIYERLLEPCPQKPRSLRSLASIEQTKKCCILIDTSLEVTIRR